MINEKGQFMKGHIPWHKGKKGLLPPSWNKGLHPPSNGTLEKYIKEHGAWNRGKKCPQFTGKNSGSFRHGMSHMRFNIIWKHLKKRCLDLSDKNYGRRGIKCLWNSFIEFRDDMYESYTKHVKEFGEKNTTIDRIDANGNYCKSNCRWATRLEQGQNRRNVIFATFDGETKTIAEWCRIKNLKYFTIRKRIIKMGWTMEDAFNKPRMKNQFG